MGHLRVKEVRYASGKISQSLGDRLSNGQESHGGPADEDIGKQEVEAGLDEVVDVLEAVPHTDFEKLPDFAGTEPRKRQLEFGKEPACHSNLRRAGHDCRHEARDAEVPHMREGYPEQDEQEDDTKDRTEKLADGI